MSAETGLSQRVGQLRGSVIREILALASQPGMISFAGGLPAASTFPTLAVNTVPAQYLQYGPSEGEPELREKIAADLRAQGLHCNAEQVLVLSGSQQGIDLVAKLFIDPQTLIALESPTYLAALQVFRFFGARITTLDPAHPAQALSGAEKPAFAYVIPTFQNPTGRCYTAQERDALAQACDDSMVPLFEDDPYRALAYADVERVPVCARLKRAPWIYQGSFSKTLTPGLRLGFLVASETLMPYLVRLKQAADLHSNRLSQWLVLEQLNDAGYAARLLRIAGEYRDKRDFFDACLHKHFADIADWQTPAGGLFFWLELKQPQDTRKLLTRAIAVGVTFMPGEAFYDDGHERLGTLRLNFSHSDEAGIEKGLSLLAALIRDQQ